MAIESVETLIEETAAEVAEETAAEVAEETAAEVAEETAAEVVEETVAEVADQTAAEVDELEVEESTDDVEELRWQNLQKLLELLQVQSENQMLSISNLELMISNQYQVMMEQMEALRLSLTLIRQPEPQLQPEISLPESVAEESPDQPTPHQKTKRRRLI